jgi:hypothetical protein
VLLQGWVRVSRVLVLATGLSSGRGGRKMRMPVAFRIRNTLRSSAALLMVSLAAPAGAVDYSSWAMTGWPSSYLWSSVPGYGSWPLARQWSAWPRALSGWSTGNNLWGSIPGAIRSWPLNYASLAYRQGSPRSFLYQQPEFPAGPYGYIQGWITPDGDFQGVMKLRGNMRKLMGDYYTRLYNYYANYYADY